MFGWIKNIGLSWKVQLAPASPVLVLLGVGAYALLALRSNQAAVDAARLRTGPASELGERSYHRRGGRRMPSCIVLQPPQPIEKDEKKVAAFAKESLGCRHQDFGGLEGGRRRSGRIQAGGP